jgi:hypothetical protein
VIGVSFPQACSHAARQMVILPKLQLAHFLNAQLVDHTILDRMVLN